MAFLIQRAVGRSLALTQIDGDVLRIGRGTQAELRSENPAVALDHAVIETLRNGWTITDRGSITGTYVNGRPVESVQLANGDVIEIGDLRLEVQKADAGEPLFLRVSSTAAAAQAAPRREEPEPPGPSLPKGGVVAAPRIDYRAAFQLRRPWLTRTSVAAAVLIAGLVLIGQVTLPQQQGAFAPGPVSSAHSRAVDARGRPIATRCEACHDPWRGVTVDRCQSCHGRMIHTINQVNPPPCASCHPEHRGTTSLAAIPDSRCVSCHAQIAAHTRGVARVANVVSFGPGHPDFVFPPDADTLRFNHRLHLQAAGVFNGHGVREVLTCTSCHRMVEVRGRLDPAPIRFAADCQRCHRLTFDPAFPDAEVPHGGGPSLVYGFILATESGNREIAGKPPLVVRQILTEHPPAPDNVRAVLEAEKVLKVKCAYCHEVRRTGGTLAVTPPVMRTRWMNAQFTHGPHLALDCETCHTAARKSSLTSDVLLPQRSACLPCHGERQTAMSVRPASNCVRCHNYHPNTSALVPEVTLASLRGGVVRADVGGGPGMIGSIVLLFIGLLLIVVFVPVGLALYQRLRPARPDAASVPPSSRPPAPGHDTAPSLAVGASAPPIQETQLIPKMPVQEETAGKTELVQWNGMLRCTSGPLEGKTFVIGDEGLYIGRDAALANIVIDDTRISKRHVRILPRGGKVWAIDQGSTNGTFLGSPGGERVVETQLKKGDTIVLADNAATFVYMI